MQLLTVRKKVLHFFKNDRVQKIQGGRCVPPNARILFSTCIRHDGASALWANSEEGQKVWNTSLEREKASLFKKWAEKADVLRKEEENMSLDEAIAADSSNQETLFITVAMGLKALIGSERGQAGEDVGFHVKMVYKPQDGATRFTCMDVMLNQESGRFSTFEGGSEAEHLWWTCFAEQVFLVPTAVNRKADNVTGKPILLQMEDDWTPVRVGKTLKEYLKGLWDFSHHPVMDPPDLPWNELNDSMCDVVPETWRGSLGDPEKMKAAEVMALYLQMHDCQDTAAAFHFVVHSEDIEGRKNINILGESSHGGHIIILESEEDDDDDDSVVVLSPSRRKLNLTKSKGARMLKENKRRSDRERGEGEHEGEREHGVDGQHHDDDGGQHDSVGSGHDNNDDGGQRDDINGGQMRRGWKHNQPPREPESASTAKGAHDDDDDGGHHNGDNGGQRDDDDVSAGQLNSDTDAEGEDDPDVRPKDRRDGEKVAKAAKMRRGRRCKQPPCEPESASNAKGGHHDDDDGGQHDGVDSGHHDDDDGGQRDNDDGGQRDNDDGGQRDNDDGGQRDNDDGGQRDNDDGGQRDNDDRGQHDDNDVSAGQLNSDTDAEGEDDLDMRPKDRRDGEKVAKAAKMRRGRKRKQPPREPESASNTKGGGRASAKKPRVAGSVASEKRLTRAATLPCKSTRIAIPTERKRFSK
ncbi:hypothetical protein BKA93DRAFT_752593 [Sparassis latifolia]